MAERDTFHHGNLRNVLIEAGHAALNESGIDGFSLRKLALRSGVSQSAPYRHFKNKEALLQELIDGGLHELHVAYQKAAEREGSPSDRLRRACEAYLDFAANRSGLFQLVFEGGDSFSATAVSSSDESPSFALFLQMVTDAGPDIPKGKELEAATVVWSIIHGFASLQCHNEISSKVDESSVRDAILDAAVQSVRQLSE